MAVRNKNKTVHGLEVNDQKATSISPGQQFKEKKHMVVDQAYACFLVQRLKTSRNNFLSLE